MIRLLTVYVIGMMVSVWEGDRGGRIKFFQIVHLSVLLCVIVSSTEIAWPVATYWRR